MVPQSILQSVFQVRMGRALGTAFTIEVDGRQYLLTARHVAEPAPPDGLLHIYCDGKWSDLKYRAISVQPPNVDITVLALSEQLSPVASVVLASMADTFLSQEVFFLGYPFGLSIDSHALNNGYPLPFVKRGIIAAFEFTGPGRCFIVDAMNNPGFSGGPVVNVRTPDKPAIIGVVSSYRFNDEPVYSGCTPTPLSVQANTGLLIAYPITQAIEAIKANPIGFVTQ